MHEAFDAILRSGHEQSVQIGQPFEAVPPVQGDVHAEKPNLRRAISLVKEIGHDGQATVFASQFRSDGLAIS
jgi:hypothetical protein